jgi:hypothetical protein
MSVGRFMPQLERSVTGDPVDSAGDQVHSTGVPDPTSTMTNRKGG